LYSPPALDRKVIRSLSFVHVGPRLSPTNVSGVNRRRFQIVDADPEGASLVQRQRHSLAVWGKRRIANRLHLIEPDHLPPRAFGNKALGEGIDPSFDIRQRASFGKREAGAAVAVLEPHIRHDPDRLSRDLQGTDVERRRHQRVSTPKDEVTARAA
jgi:hypothetical protein